MRVSRTAVQGVIFALATTLWIGATTPAHAFRMIQNLGIGRVTAGAIVPCNDPNGFTHWDTRTITWRHNTDRKGSGKGDELAAALAAWSTAAGSEYNLALGGTTEAGFATDGINTFSWSNDDGCDAGCLGLTALVLEAGQVIVESDITFRNAVWWGWPSGNDIQGVATHEVGHSLGIHHTDVTGAPTPTMIANTNQQKDLRSLEQDDRNALTCSQNTFPVMPPLGIRYRAHVQGQGWHGWVANGQTAGTTGQGKRMEAVRIEAINPRPGMSICYRAHVQGTGWQSTVCNGATAGTTGQGKRMEAIRITASNRPPGCNLEYRAHVKGKGWLGWVSNGATAGTTGEGRRMEALQVRFVGTCN